MRFAGYPRVDVAPMTQAWEADPSTVFVRRLGKSAQELGYNR